MSGRTGFLTYSDVRAVTPSDSAYIAQTSGISIGAAGTLAVTTAAGTVVTITGLAIGVIHPIAAIRVMATGTSATGITVYYT